MDISLLKSVVDYAIERLVAGKPVVKCPGECVAIGCQFDNCLENGLMADYHAKLSDLSKTLEGWLYREAASESYQRLNFLDEAIVNLQESIKLDIGPLRPVTIIINGKPHVMDMDPILADDLQRLIHRQIANHYADVDI